MPPASATDLYADTKLAAATAEETRTNEELDTEVSQINTQSNKTQSNEPAESYSRPMSRTSSMTPVIKLIFFYSLLTTTIYFVFHNQCYGFRIYCKISVFFISAFELHSLLTAS